MSNVQEEVYAWKGLGKDGPGPTFSFYSDGTVRVTLADGKGTITLDPTGNVIADPVDGEIEGFGGTATSLHALDDIQNVSAGAPNDGDVLTYHADSQEWWAIAPAGGTPTSIVGSGGTVDATAASGVTATLSSGKRWTFDLADADPSVVLRGAPASNGAQIEFRNIANDVLLGRVFADASDVVLLHRSVDGSVDTAKLYLDVTGEIGLQNRVDGSDITLAAGGDILVNVASGKKLGLFGSSGTVQGVAAAITDFASLKTYLQALGMIGA